MTIASQILNPMGGLLEFISEQLGKPGGPGFFRDYRPQIIAVTVSLPYVTDALTLISDLYTKRKITADFKASVISFLNVNKVNIVASLSIGALFLAFGDTNENAIYTGYTILTAAHLYGVSQDFLALDKLNFIKHLFATTLSALTINEMRKGVYATRWHHMSYGLVAMLPNLNALNSWGACLVLDSACYWIKPKRDNYDFANVYTSNLAAYISQLVILSVYEIGRKIILA